MQGWCVPLRGVQRPISPQVLTWSTALPSQPPPMHTGGWGVGYNTCGNRNEEDCNFTEQTDQADRYFSVSLKPIVPLYICWMYHFLYKPIDFSPLIWYDHSFCTTLAIFTLSSIEWQVVKEMSRSRQSWVQHWPTTVALLPAHTSYLSQPSQPMVV